MVNQQHSIIRVPKRLREKNEEKMLELGSDGWLLRQDNYSHAPICETVPKQQSHYCDVEASLSALVMKVHLKFCRTKLSLCFVVVENSFILTVKHPTKIMIWSVISGQGTGRLNVVKGMMQQYQYKDVLQNRLIPLLEEWFPNGESYIFMQDGAPCHTALSIKAFLAVQNILLLDWPGNSPDMNPIENVWDLMEREVAKDVITNKTQFLEIIILV
ncbi:transposable element Tcb2 transposase [Trichonephila clavipes]|nr:transposable element Tcb2 transposase [Trichonephila clavipes]